MNKLTLTVSQMIANQKQQQLLRQKEREFLLKLPQLRQERRQFEWHKSNDDLEIINAYTKWCERMMNMAIKFCDRMKGLHLITEENEFEYTNYVYNQLIEGQAWNEDILSPEIANAKSTSTNTKTRLSLIASLRDQNDDLELLDKRASDTRVFYCVDDSKVEYDSNGELFGQRKIRCAQDTVTGNNEVFEIGYMDPSLSEDLVDIYDKVDISQVVFCVCTENK